MKMNQLSILLVFRVTLRKDTDRGLSVIFVKVRNKKSLLPNSLLLLI